MDLLHASVAFSSWVPEMTTWSNDAPWVGSMAAWASALGATAAFTATFYVIRRDARIRRLAQARKVALYETDYTSHRSAEGGKFGLVTLVVDNQSDEIIYDVMLHLTAGRPPQPVDLLGHAPLLLPKGVYTDLERKPHAAVVTFRDAGGNHWLRTLDGHLLELTRIRRRLSPYFRQVSLGTGRLPRGAYRRSATLNDD